MYPGQGNFFAKKEVLFKIKKAHPPLNMMVRNILIVYYIASIQRYSQIIFDNDFLAIFAGISQKYSYPPPPPEYDYFAETLQNNHVHCPPPKQAYINTT